MLLSRLNEPYEFSCIFNLEKIFNLDLSKEIDIDSLPLLPDKWLKELEILCQKENCFSKHIGIYPKIENALKFIYHRLTGNFDDALGPLVESERTVILAKLVEDIEACSDGFYSRINDIITTFQLPKNLSQLLCQVRIELVKKIAARLTNEVHAWNSVTKIAALQGLGVPANFSEDQYPGTLSGIQIMEDLKQEFEGTFTPYCLSYLLVDQLRGLLAKVGYNGLRKEKSYVFGEAEMITETIKLYLSEDFKDTPYQEFFLIDEETFFIQDLNWIKIKEYFLLTLSNEKYFLKEATPDTICNLYDYACFINLYPIYDSKLEINPNFFDKNTAYFELQKIKTDFPLFWTKLKSHPVLISKLKMLVDELIENRFLKAGIYEKIKILFSVDLDTIFEKNTFYDFLFKLRTLEDWNALMLVAYSYPEGLEPLLNFLSDNSICFDAVLCQKMFSKIDRDGWNVLMLATRYQPKGLEPLLNFLSKQTTCFYQTTCEKLFLQTDKEGWNVLELAAWYHPEKLQLLLSFLPGRAPWLARVTQALFLQTTPSGANVLMVAAHYYPERLEPLLDFLSKQASWFNQTNYKNILFKTNNNGWNVLMLAACYQPEGLESLLIFLSRYSAWMDQVSCQNLLLQADRDGWNTLKLAARHQPEKLERLLSFLLKQFTWLDQASYKELFLQVDQNGWNIFKLLVCYHPEKLDSLFVSISSQSSWFDHADCKKLFLQSDENGWNPLMRVIHDQLGGLKQLLGFLSKHSEWMDQATCKEILLQKDKHGCNALMLAARYHPEGLEPLLNFLSKHSEWMDQATCKEILLQKDKHECNALMLAARYHPEGLEPLLNFLSKYSEWMDQATCKKILLQKDKHGRNALMLAARYHPEGLEALLNFLSKHSETMDQANYQEIFLQTDQDGLNVLMLAFDYHPNRLGPLLSFFLEKSKSFDTDSFKDFFLQKDRTFWKVLMLQTLDKPEIGVNLLKCLLKSYGVFNKEILESILSIVSPNSDLTVLIAHHLITAYLDEIKDRNKKNILYTSRFFGRGLGFSSQEKEKAAFILKDCLEVLDQKHKANNLQTLRGACPALSNGRLGTIFKFVFQSTANEVSSQNTVSPLPEFN